MFIHICRPATTATSSVVCACNRVLLFALLFLAAGCWSLYNAAAPCQHTIECTTAYYRYLVLAVAFIVLALLLFGAVLSALCHCGPTAYAYEHLASIKRPQLCSTESKALFLALFLIVACNFSFFLYNGVRAAVSYQEPFFQLMEASRASVGSGPIFVNASLPRNDFECLRLGDWYSSKFQRCNFEESGDRKAIKLPIREGFQAFLLNFGCCAILTILPTARRSVWAKARSRPCCESATTRLLSSESLLQFETLHLTNHSAPRSWQSLSSQKAATCLLIFHQRTTRCGWWSRKTPSRRLQPTNA